jgi:DeoR/GlpR family transcriptional regulator of sugar metabolism
MVRLGQVSQIDALFTDRPLSSEMQDMLKAADVTLHVAGEAAEEAA